MTESASGFDRRALIRTGIGVAAATAIGTELALPAAAAAAPAPAAPAGQGHPASPTSIIDFIITCDSWAARPPSTELVMNTGTTQKIMIHHTAYPNSTDYSVNQAIWLARDIQNLHMDVNAFSDTGQHFTVSRGGFVLEGRHRSLEGLRSGAGQVVSAHCPGENGRAIGIENEGTYITETPPKQLLDSLIELCVAIATRYRLGPNMIFGHWDFRATQCPGIAFYKLFPGIRRAVGKALGTKLSEVPERTWPTVLANQTGAVITVVQYLLRHHGYDITPTGTFNAATVLAVQDFQVRNGLPPAGLGEVTNETWDKLVPRPLAPGATGDPVSAVQSILVPKGYEVTVTGVFDAATHAAVREMQHLHDLPRTGTIDLATWCAIAGGIVRQEFTRALKA
jgi:N-acetyl-anhydromuramyl-L-alanine amidase AmpD